MFWWQLITPISTENDLVRLILDEGSNQYPFENVERVRPYNERGIHLFRFSPNPFSSYAYFPGTQRDEEMGLLGKSQIAFCFDYITTFLTAWSLEVRETRNRRWKLNQRTCDISGGKLKKVSLQWPGEASLYGSNRFTGCTKTCKYHYKVRLPPVLMTDTPFISNLLGKK